MTGAAVNAQAEAFYLGVVADVRFRGWAFMVKADGPDHYLQARFVTPDDEVATPRRLHHGRKWRLSPYMTRSEIVQTALAAVLAAVEHEAREDFRYKGEAVFGPHFDVEGLRLLAQAGACERRA